MSYNRSQLIKILKLTEAWNNAIVKKLSSNCHQIIIQLVGTLEHHLFNPQKKSDRASVKSLKSNQVYVSLGESSSTNLLQRNW